MTVYFSIFDEVVFGVGFSLNVGQVKIGNIQKVWPACQTRRFIDILCEVSNYWFTAYTL